MDDGALWPLPPYTRVTDFLPPEEHEALLEWTLANQAAFKTATVTGGLKESKGRVDPDIRIASVCRDLGPIRSLLEGRLQAALPKLMAATGIKGPEPRSLELEIAAHGDGAHYQAHVDLSLGPDRKPLGASTDEDRVLSAVYYFYREPRKFGGGALRLYRFGAHLAADPDAEANWIDLEPLQNSLVAFPPWATHAVMPISCQTGAFADSRFALNCWYCRKL